MTMTTFDNREPLDGWRLPPRCCGDWQTKLHCTTCGTLVPENCVLGEN